MRKENLAGKVIEMYDSIDDLPIARFHKYNKMLLVDAGIGSDIADFDRHIEKAIIYNRTNKPEELAKELENMRQNVYFVQSNISPRFMAFAVLIKSINGRAFYDLSDDGLQAVLAEIADAPNKQVTALLEAVKKKIDEELRLYFPRLFDSANLKEYFDKLRRRTLVVLDTLVNGATESATDEIRDITDELMTYFAPETFAGANSAEVKFDRQFENMCLVLSKNLNVRAKEYTVLEYYNAFEYLQEEGKKAKRRKAAK